MRFFALIGPSAVGKSTIAWHLLDLRHPNLKLVKKYTTRPQRSGTSNETEDIFLTDAEFDNTFKKGDFVATIQPFGLPYRYGLKQPRLKPDEIGLVLLRSFVLDEFLKLFPDTVVIQIEAPLGELRQRMKGRGQSEDDIKARMKSAEIEFQQGRNYAKHVLFNDDLEATLRNIKILLLNEFGLRYNET